MAGIITNQGFGYVANWLYMGMVLKIFFSLVALSILSFAGYRVVPWLLATAGKPERRITSYNVCYTKLLRVIRYGHRLKGLSWIITPIKRNNFV